MVWTQRIGYFAKSVVVLVIDLFTIVTEIHARLWELAARLSRDVDEFFDGLKEKL